MQIVQKVFTNIVYLAIAYLIKLLYTSGIKRRKGGGEKYYDKKEGR